MSIALRFAVPLLLALAAATPAPAAETVAPPTQSWSFAGPFGRFDQAQLQRGFKVFREVCVTCHTLERVAFRNLTEPGGPGFAPEEIETLLADWPVQVKTTNDQGEPVERAPRLADRFPSQYANEAAARTVHNGALPPDLSVIAKARTYERGFPLWVTDIFTQYNENGVDYIAALLTGYAEAPQDVAVPQGSYYNRYFPGHVLAMAPPLSDGQVEYADGTPATTAQHAKDVAAFLMWAAEPHLEARKRIGLQVMLFLMVFCGLLYFTKKKVWRRVVGHA